VKKNVLFNQRVTKIDYSSNIVKIYTSSTVYNARRVISSLPLGVMQHRKVEFSPPLPQKHQESLEKIGVGIFNKLFISFEEPFWGTRKGWLHMVTSSGSSKYP
jgi:polyamine oxidase